MSRRTARKQAFLVLYQSDVNESMVGDVVRRWREYRGELDPYAIQLCRGVEGEVNDLDTMLTEVSVGWPVRRMNSVDRTILRIALFEMLRVDDVPPDIAVNEAIELTKGFSSEEAPAFVAGVLRGAETKFSRVSHG